ncbi:hypothetical protein CLOM_g8744 [Closterium sp. NIES-68]|nr:hypothetical protein CLOM_g8744 [Closterium sp. NIES-68]GJP64771.1 hypothetical protein CLOP_g21719 [Closterium sp. NIES-67]
MEPVHRSGAARSKGLPGHGLTHLRLSNHFVVTDTSTASVFLSTSLCSSQGAASRWILKSATCRLLALLVLPALLALHSLISSRTQEGSSQVLDARLGAAGAASTLASAGADTGVTATASDAAASRGRMASWAHPSLDSSSSGSSGIGGGGSSRSSDGERGSVEQQQQEQQQQQQGEGRVGSRLSQEEQQISGTHSAPFTVQPASAASLGVHPGHSRDLAYASESSSFDDGGAAAESLQQQPKQQGQEGEQQQQQQQGQEEQGSERFYRVTGEGDYCAGESHWKWSFLCAAAEARLLNRTLVLPLARCLSGRHTLSHVTEEKPMALYYRMDHWPRIQPIMLDLQFELRFGSLNATILRTHHNMSVRGFQAREPTSRLETAEARAATLVVRNAFFAYEICTPRENAKRLVRNYNLIQRPKYLWRVAEAIRRSMGFDFDSVHVRRGDKLNRHFWPHLDRDTRPDALLRTLPRFIQPGRHVYIASNERTPGFFSPLSSLYKIHVLSDYRHLWAPGSDWYTECWELMQRHRIKLGAKPVFDAQMQWIVDEILMSQAKKRVETFFDLTNDTRHAV